MTLGTTRAVVLVALVLSCGAALVIAGVRWITQTRRA